MRLTALFLHVPRDDHTGKEKCKQPETQETCKTNKSLAGPPSLWKYMEYSPAFQTSPSEQACPSPANLIKRQSARNQKCLKEQAINSSHMLDKCPGCRRNGSSAGAEGDICSLLEAESITVIKLYKNSLTLVK